MLAVLLFPCALMAGVVYSTINLSQSTVTGEESNRTVYSWSDGAYFSFGNAVVTGTAYQAVTKTNVTGGGSVTNVFTTSNTVALTAVVSSNAFRGSVSMDDGSFYEQYISSCTSVWHTVPSKEFVTRVVMRGDWVQIQLTQKMMETVLIIPCSKIRYIKAPAGQFTEWPYNKK